MSPSRNRTYTAWYSMHSRHRTEICPEWSDYQTFHRDMGEKPAGRNVTLCRRNHRLPYSQANCYWGVKNHNGRKTVLVYGVCLSEWARRIGKPQQRLSEVKKRCGLSGLQTYIAERVKHEQAACT